ncbi:MAG: hypothetical protein GY745_01935 [Actinomycetia bacterium]|nr:hypothetical protein [Actinomycetes bacterium]MCP3910220.1 hypothetical protein [Actinomycetes bacterium]MCP4083808.1 hypothetical protein [Actinomycetes bacterium]
MAELTLLSTGLLHSSCAVVEDGHDRGRIEPHAWPGRARVVVDHQPYDLRRDHLWRGPYRLRKGDAEVARATGTLFKRHFHLSFETATGETTCELKGSRPLTEWTVEMGGAEVGAIRPLSGVRLRGRASLPDEFGPVGQLFCCALVVAMVGRRGLPTGVDGDHG